MSQTQTTAAPDAAKSSATTHAPAPVVQNAPGQHLDPAASVGGEGKLFGEGSPRASAASYGALLGASGVGVAANAGLLRQLQRGYGNSYVGAVIQRKCDCGGTCGGCSEKKELQRKGEGAALGGVPAGAAAAMQRSGAGQPLDAASRSRMEAGFGYDFGGVRVHTDGAAAEAARGLRAQAFTTGQDIYFGAGRYQPRSEEGSRLLAHELTHVVQQGRGAVSATSSQRSAVSEPGDALEREADAVAERVVGGQALAAESISAGGQSQVQRDWIDDALDEAADVASDVGGAIEEGAEAVGEVASDVGEAVVEGAEAVGEAVVEGAEAAGEAIVEGAEAVGEALADAGEAIYEGAVALADAVGGVLSAIAGGLVIELPPMQVCDMMQLDFDLPEYQLFIPIVEGRIELTNSIMEGELGINFALDPELILQLGPCVLHSVQIVINPLTGTYSIGGALSATTGISIGYEFREGARAEGRLIVTHPDVFVYIDPIAMEAGLAGQVRAIGVQTWTVGGTLGTGSSLLGPTLSFTGNVGVDFGLAADIGVGAYAQIDLLGLTMCRLYWPFWEWHGDAAANLGLSVTLTGILTSEGPLLDFDIDGAAAWIPFGNIPNAFDRSVLQDDCQLCDILYQLGFMPSQNGGTWTGHPKPAWPGPLFEVFPTDPRITSEALCRGACGYNCTTCDGPVNVYACEDSPDGSEHFIWHYPNYLDCPTHLGCRNHDACYDWCADNQEKSIIGPCHRLCDLECSCVFDLGSCAKWVAGVGGNARMNFSDEPVILGPFPGPCRDAVIPPLIPPDEPPVVPEGDCPDQGPGPFPTVVFDIVDFPEIAPHIDDAQSAGHPRTLTRTTDQRQIDRNRRAACGRHPGPRSCDEYPFASSFEGGAGASTRDVPLGENNRQGGHLGGFYRRHGIGHCNKYNVEARI